MVTIKKQELSLVVQANRLKSYFPDSKCFIRNNTLTWKGYLQPMCLSQKYLIKVVYQREKHPNVYVLEPKPLVLADGKTELEHNYDTKKQHLCLYYREAWVATGTWYGGGIHFVSKS